MDSDAISQAVPRPTDRGRAGECILQSADRSVETQDPDSTGEHQASNLRRRNALLINTSPHSANNIRNRINWFSWIKSHLGS